MNYGDLSITLNAEAIRSLLQAHFERLPVHQLVVHATLLIPHVEIRLRCAEVLAVRILGAEDVTAEVITAHGLDVDVEVDVRAEIVSARRTRSGEACDIRERGSALPWPRRLDLAKLAGVTRGSETPASALSAATLSALAECLAAEPSVRVAALFGSAAREKLGPGSDIDIYAVLEPGPDPSIFWRANLAGALEAIAGMPVDLIIEQRDRTSLILRSKVFEEGRLLFQRTPSAWTTTKANILIDYGDMADAISTAVTRGRELLLSRSAHG